MGLDLFVPPPVTERSCEEFSDQFTGYEDRNGRDIYEGDYLEQAETLFVRKVVLDDLRGWGRELRDGTRLFPLFSKAIHSSPEDYEVLGDMHTVGIAIRL